MIYFFADNHFEARPGYHLYEKLKGDFNIKFFEDDISPLSIPGFLKNCDLFMINLICGTGKIQETGPEDGAEIKKYCMAGKPLFLIHAGSAAFSNWDWWRKLTGLRWVREKDLEGLPPSVHPVKDFTVTRVASSHPLAVKLKGFGLKNDEIYTKLAQTAPADVLLETKIEEGTFPMAFISRNDWGGNVAGFLPGHKADAFENRSLVDNIGAIIEFLLNGPE